MSDWQMVDYQQIVEEIQSAVAAPEAADPDLLRDTAAEFAAGCEEVNGRLKECARLLQRGLRSEAIQLAEREPKLLDLAALLDFPELNEWKQLLRSWGMVVPPPIQIAIATDLNRAYSEEAPLQSLLKQHRLLALGRAPLPLRIATLRAIARVDLANPVWSDDLRTMEIARMQEMLRDGDVAYKQGDLLKLDGLLQELSSDGWVNNPGPELATQLVHRRRTLAAFQARAELAILEKRLNDAYSAFDVENGRAARSRWLELLKVAGLDANDPLTQRSAPALNWLHEQDGQESRQRGFSSAVCELEQSLEGDLPRNQLERRYHQALRFEEQIPPLVTQRYKERIRALDRTASRKFRLLVGVAAVSLAFVAGTTVWWIRDSQHEAAVTTSAEAFGRLVNEARLAEAQKFYEQLTQQQPAIAKRPEVQQHHSRLADLITKQEERQTAFSNALARVEAAGLDQPDRLSLNEAEILAVTPEEKSRIVEWEAKFATTSRRRQQQRDDEFLEQFRKLRKRVEELEQIVTSGEDQPKSAFNQLTSEIDVLLEHSGGVTAAVVSQGKPLRLRVKALLDQTTAYQSRNEALRTVTTAVGNPRLFRESLAYFVKTFPESGEAAEFRIAAEEIDLWDILEHWRTFANDKRLVALDKLAPKDAQQIVQKWKSEPFGELPYAAEFRERIPFLEGVAARMKTDGEYVVKDLRKLFEDPLISALWVIRTPNGECFYLKQPIKAEDFPKKDSDGTIPVRFKYLTGFDLSEAEITRKFKVVTCEIAPQSRIATQAIRELRMAHEMSWERGFLRLVELIRTEEQLDPVLKLTLLKRVASVATAGSCTLKTALAPIIMELDSAGVDLTTNWLAPDPKVASGARAEAQRVLKKLVGIATSESQTISQLNKETRPLAPPPVCVGWLRRDIRSGWQLRSAKELRETGFLFVVHRIGASTQVGWTKVGELRAGKVEWDTAGLTMGIAGRPIYLQVLAVTADARAESGTRVSN